MLRSTETSLTVLETQLLSAILACHVESGNLDEHTAGVIGAATTHSELRTLLECYLPAEFVARAFNFVVTATPSHDAPDEDCPF